MIAALFVETDGVYFGLPDVECWDEKRDARLYAGPYPVVAHPPCARWGRYWSGGPSARVRRFVGDDSGCFDRALWAVRTFGGVLEHPEASKAWDWYGLERPLRKGGWTQVDMFGGRSCCIEQGHYGHKARKATWLYYIGAQTPQELIWGPSIGDPNYRVGEGFHSKEDRRRATRTGAVQRLSKRQRAATPRPFRDVLLGLASKA